MADAFSSAFMKGLEQLKLSLREQQLEQLLHYRQELLDWNTRINLTAITNPEEVLLKHFLDSLSLLSIWTNSRAKFLDIGSGAGFPGMVLKIAHPEWEVTLLEATGKKVRFLQHIVDTLHLSSTVVIHGRAEELAHNLYYRGQFELVTARAVSSLSTLLEYAAPYCCVNGQMIFPKKGDLGEELTVGKRAASLLGVVFTADVPVTLPGLDDGRRLLLWRQQKLCPAQYPRSGSAIARKPLG